jgi:hypothetical protein
LLAGSGEERLGAVVFTVDLGEVPTLAWAHEGGLSIATALAGGLRLSEKRAFVGVGLSDTREAGNRLRTESSPGVRLSYVWKKAT